MTKFWKMVSFALYGLKKLLILWCWRWRSSMGIRGLAGGWLLDTCKGHITAEGPRLLLQTTHDDIWTSLNHVARLAAGCYASAFAFLFLSELNCVSQKEIKAVCSWEEGRGKKKKLKLKKLRINQGGMVIGNAWHLIRGKRIFQFRILNLLKSEKIIKLYSLIIFLNFNKN